MGLKSNERPGESDEMCISVQLVDPRIAMWYLLRKCLIENDVTRADRGIVLHPSNGWDYGQNQVCSE